MRMKGARMDLQIVSPLPDLRVGAKDLRMEGGSHSRSRHQPWLSLSGGELSRRQKKARSSR